MKTAAGEIVEPRRLDSTRETLETWAAAQPPWRGAMEATLFSGWISTRSILMPPPELRELRRLLSNFC